jgi:predicted ATPase/class 3 adenylate cyclase
VSELPRGTVTFLFTDVEGSTRLLQELGRERYVRALEQHRRLLREAFTSEDGVEVEMQGDSFFFAFARAGDAVRAADAGQRALAEHASEAGSIRVRMGVHTGEPVISDSLYAGLDVHRAARVMGAGHGGQVLVSEATRALLGDEFELRDLGEHRLKDLLAPERLFQLGDRDFPPLNSLNRTELPIAATPFLGRDEELRQVVELVRRDDVRLCTLTGPGGTGKTRLALQAAAEAAADFLDGVWWVPLAPLRDPTLVLSTVANTLDVQEHAGASLSETMTSALSGKRVLLLLDNAEHLLPDVANDVARLRDVHGPKLLVTSRERLRLQGEHAWSVPALEERDGVALFTTRARAADPSFIPSRAVARLCDELDNLPLALELAAAHVTLFSPEQLLERLGQRLDLTGDRDVDPRQQTLRATIAWSYDLLSAGEQQLFVRLAVFAGGCTYEAAESICGADPPTLQALIDKSLVRRREAAGGPRYWMLETVREFAVELLEASPSAAETQMEHARFFARFVEEADAHVRRGPDQQLWSERMAADYDNVRIAVAHALDAAPEFALRIVGSLPFFVWLRGGFREAQGWVDAALARGGGMDPRLVARVHACGAAVAERIGDFPAVARHAEDAYAASVSAGDEFERANALRERAKAAVGSGDLKGARETLTELAELAGRIGDPWNGAIALNNLGDLALHVGEWEEVVALCSRSSAIRLDLGDRWGAALARINVASAEYQLGRIDDAASSLRVVLQDILELGATMVVAACLDVYVSVVFALGKPHEAACLFGAAERLREELANVREAFEQDVLDESVSALRSTLGDDAFVAKVERGRRLSVAEATEYALGATSPGLPNT